MALTSTIYAVRVELSHVDRGVYESLDLRLARHPSETAEYLVTRLLAYCLEHEDGIAFGDGISTADEPAVLVRDLTGRITKWIEVGMPSADRVYTHRDARQVLAQLDGQGVHRAAAIPVHAFAPSFIEPLAASLDRRSQLTLNVMDGHLYVETAAGSLDAPLAAASFS
jgi:uncharacterized protein YaeQ